MKTTTIGLLVCLLISPFNASADIIIDEPTCNIFQTTRTTGSTFRLKGDPEYPGGLLRLNFAYENYPGSSFNMFSFILRAANCEVLNATDFFFGSALPANVTDFSIRFASDTAYRFYDDSTDQSIDCPACAAGFTTAVEPPYKFSMFISDDNTGGNIETRAFDIRGEGVGEKTPVLLVPGIGGTELFYNNEVSWLDLVRMLQTNDVFLLNELGLDDAGNDNGLVSLGDIIREVNLDFLPDTNIFSGLILELENEGFIAEESYFVFPYDWRKDLNVSSIKLNKKIEQIKTLTGSAKVDVVAHSMGGLVVENYLEEFGKQNINKLVFIGTPHLGAPKAGKALLEGYNFDIPLLNSGTMRYLVQNFPSVYELLPSPKYFDNFQGYIAPYSFSSPQLLDYDDTKDWLVEEEVNSSMLQQAEEMFVKDLSSFDFSGIDVYNIVGCKIATQAAYRYALGNFTVGRVGYVSGDKTVPLPSADALDIPANHRYYVKNGSHGELPSTDGVKELVVGIFNDEMPTTNNISNSAEFCNFQGKTLTWRSPVEVHVYSQGFHSGPADWGLENSIPGVDYEIFNGEKFMFLPTDEGQEYEIASLGEKPGTFDLLISENDNGTTGSTFVYDNVPVASGTPIAFNLSETSADDFILVNNVPVPAYSQIIAVQAEDLVPPEISVQYDLTDDRFIFWAVDSLDPNPAIECDNDSCIAVDGAGNQTEIIFELTDKKINNKFILKTVSYNHNAAISMPENVFHVEFREKRAKLRDFDQFIRIKKVEKIRINYQRKHDQSTVIESWLGERARKTLYPGLKFLRLSTQQGNINLEIN